VVSPERLTARQMAVVPQTLHPVAQTLHSKDALPRRHKCRRPCCLMRPQQLRFLLHVLPPLQTLQSKAGEEGADESEPLSAVQLALKRQRAQGPPPGFPAVPEPAGTGVAAVAAASHGHLHMPCFEQVDIGR
jgi:hypothetical protein